MTTCKFQRYVCRVCNRQGHLKRMCPNVTGQHHVDVTHPGSNDEGEVSGEEEVVFVNISKLSSIHCSPLYVKLNINGKDINMECDTGSAISCISKECYNKLFSDLPLEPCQLVLKYYTGETVRPLGLVRPLVEYKGRKKILELYVIENGRTVLLGRQWMSSLKIQLPTFETDLSLMYNESNEFDVSRFSSKYCDVFADGLGRFTGGTVSVTVREGARPVFMRARPLAYALREPVERALDQMVRDGILTPVERSDWATPIVPVVKKDGNIRICADYKITLNKVLEVDRYPLPRMEDLLVRLEGGRHFSKIDLSQAYAQFELDNTKKYTVINTHKGLYMYNRLVYGLASSPGIFQRRLEQLFSDLPNVGVFLDDIIITGSTTMLHIQNLHKVFDRLQKYGLRVKKEKCVFFADSVKYLGHTISKDGIRTCPDKVQAIVKTPTPTTVSELRAFIGMVMYYGKFIKGLSTIMAPLYSLLKAGAKYIWNEECQTAFEQIKSLLASSEVLTHYSAELPLVLTTDASSVGLGAVLAHVTPRGERPVAYASRALTAAEKAYAQIDREALSIVYGVRKFHQYLYGRKFILRTDHKPLTYILGDKVGIPVMAASRLQRWAIMLSGYNYDIQYVSSSKNCADGLSRLPCKSVKHSNVESATYVNFVENFLPITSSDVKNKIISDRVLSKIMLYACTGWPQVCSDDELKPYFSRRNEIYVECGCLMWGYRMIIPIALQQCVLSQLHSAHLGIVKTKSLGRSYVWWPNIDRDIESLCKECETCAAEADAPPRAPIQPWPFHARPWTRVHIDFLGPYKNQTFLVLVDSTSKWIEIFEMSRTNATNVIKVLRSTFARFGLPNELVSDQGPPFTSAEFQSFLNNNGIKQSFSPAYHPSSNGAAENAVKICKRAIKKAYRDRLDIDTALQTFLLAYRNTPHSSTGESPAMLLQRRSLRCRLDALRPERAVLERVREAQRRQVEAAGGVLRPLAEGDQVWARGYSSQDKWVKGTVTGVSNSSRRYSITGNDGQLLQRHANQIRRRSILSDVTCPISQSPESEGAAASISDEKTTGSVSPVTCALPPAETNDSQPVVNSQQPAAVSLDPSSTQPENKTYSQRIRKPVIRFQID